jgi:hypothetical protein
MNATTLFICKKKKEKKNPTILEFLKGEKQWIERADG